MHAFMTSSCYSHYRAHQQHLALPALPFKNYSTAGATQLHRAVKGPHRNAAPQRVDLYRPGPAEMVKMAPTGAFLLEKSLSAKKKAGFVTAVEPAEKQ